MNREIIRLYPQHGKLRDGRGLYLAKNLHRQGFTVYANFVSSLDGRIAIQSGDTAMFPENLSSPTDLRLLLELQAQADCVITHAGYLRARADGRLGDILRVGALPEHRDLVAWRQEQALPPQPLIVVCSTSLDFPLPDDFTHNRVWIATCASANRRRVAELREAGYRVIITKQERQVDGHALMSELRAVGMNGVFLLAGPVLFETLLTQQYVNHLFITVSHQLIGQADFLTLIPGLRAQSSPCVLTQKELLFAPGDEDTPGDWFAHFACRY